MKRIAIAIVVIASFIAGFFLVVPATKDGRPSSRPKTESYIENSIRSPQGDFGFRKYFPAYVADTTKFERIWWSHYHPSAYPQTHPKFHDEVYWMRSLAFPIFQDSVGGGMFPEYPERFTLIRNPRIVWDSSWETGNMYPQGLKGEEEDGGAVYVWERDATTDPRYTEWWMLSVGTPYVSLHDAVEHAALSKYHPDITEAIIRHMEEMGIVNPKEVYSLPSYRITDVLIRYTDAGLYTLILEIKAKMGTELLTKETFETLRPGDRIISYWWDGMHGCLGPSLFSESDREIAEVRGDTILAYYEHGFVEVRNILTTKGCFTQKSDRERITWEKYAETPAHEAFLAIHRKK